ncbi:MAG: FAD:protein FMN transferase [Gammaproteobacteria bacterium]|nr:FAD:protein FMN transferase [Gammaproteobacteria bacterium]
MLIKQVKWLALGALAIFLFGCNPNSAASNDALIVKLAGRTMGTTYHISYVAVAKNSERTAQAHQEVIDSLLEKVNDQMSTYRPGSELSRFNSSSSNTPFAVSADTAMVVSEAIRLSHLTDNLLDVTVGPLVNLWGFGPQMRPETVPSIEVIAQTKQRVGIEHLAVDGNFLLKDIPDLYVDLSTIAKGFGVDKVAQYLERKGITDYLVEIGGEIRAKGRPTPERDWIIAIEKPVSDERVVQQLISPLDNGLATSGDYRIYYEENGIRFSHIIDPNSGQPINHKLVSVTVIHPSSMTADGLSTAIMIMGPEAGFNFAKDQHLAVFMIFKTDNGFEEVYTDAFKPYLVSATVNP